MSFVFACLFWFLFFSVPCIALFCLLLVSALFVFELVLFGFFSFPSICNNGAPHPLTYL